MGTVSGGSDKNNGGCNIMYIHFTYFTLIAAAFLGFMYFRTPPEADVSAYQFTVPSGGDVRTFQFSGRNDYVMLNNGVIALTDRGDRFFAGDLRISANVPHQPMSSYTWRFFFYDEHGVSVTYATGGLFMSIMPNFIVERPAPDFYIRLIRLDSPWFVIGSPDTDCEPLNRYELFGIDDVLRNNLGSIIDSLHFEISISFANWGRFETTLALDVRDIWYVPWARVPLFELP